MVLYKLVGEQSSLMDLDAWRLPVDDCLGDESSVSVLHTSRAGNMKMQGMVEDACEQLTCPITVGRAIGSPIRPIIIQRFHMRYDVVFPLFFLAQACTSSRSVQSPLLEILVPLRRHGDQVEYLPSRMFMLH